MRATALLVILLSIFKTGKSEHISGSEIYYDMIGSDSVRVHLIMYRECHFNQNSWNSLNGFDGYVSVWDENNVYQSTLNLDLIDIINLDIIPQNSCVLDVGEACMEKGSWVGTFSLSEYNISNNCIFATSSYLRSWSITNLPETFGLTISTVFHNSSGENNSPVFSNPPTPVLCVGSELTVDFSATDQDGDELVYSLTPPLGDDNNLGSSPSITNPPPFESVPFSTGYSMNNLLGGQSSIQINSTTGILLVEPAYVGLFVFAVKVEEYRNGLLISSVTRDFMYYVSVCDEIELDLGADISTCEDDLTLSSNLDFPVSYIWSTGSTEDQIEVNGSGEYYLDISNGDGCFDSDTIEVQFFNNPLIDLGNDTIICSDSLFLENQLENDTPLTYLWSNGESSASIFSPSGELWLEISNGTCSSTDTISINNQSVTIDLMNDTIVCDLNEFIIDFETQGIYDYFNWSPGTFNPLSSPQDTGWYYAEIGNQYCQNIDSIHIQEVEIYGEIAFQTDSLCSPFINYYQANDSIINDNLAYFQWVIEGDTINDESIIQFSYEQSPNDSISLIITTEQGCTFAMNEFDSSQVYPSPEANFSFTNSNYFLPAEVLFFNKSLEADNYIWNFGNGDTSNLANPQSTYLEENNFEVELIASNNFGCLDTSIQVIEIVNEATIFAPNTFSPNNDGMNDFFTLAIQGIEDFEIFVFDRWGRILWEGNKENPSWDGRTKNSNEIVKIDVYVYKIIALSKKHKQIVKTGNITVIK